VTAGVQRSWGAREVFFVFVFVYIFSNFKYSTGFEIIATAKVVKT
jgi:hypothetical protein